MKRISCAFLAVLLAVQCGCSSPMDKEYFSVTDYDAEYSSAAEPEIGSISSYSQLTAALSNMVSKYQEKSELQFNNYAGNISDDLAEACWQLKSGNALGAYMVDYISYDISRIVTYYQATVYINFARSEGELSEIKSVGANKIADTVVEAVSSGKEHVAMQVYTSEIDASAMSERVEMAILGVPELISVMPELNVDVFSGLSLQHIYNVSFKYSVSPDKIDRMRTELESAISSSAKTITSDGAYSIAILTARRIADNCTYKSDQTTGTAYDVLINGVGDSRAMAMAYSAVCSEKGVENLIVSGLKNNEQHYWSLVKIDNFWYHVDVTEVKGLDNDVVFLKNDAETAKNYRWDELDYPTCDGPSLAAASDTEKGTTA